MIALECGHTFHKRCITKWATKKGGPVGIVHCPFKCKFAGVDVDDDDGVTDALAENTSASSAAGAATADNP